MVFIGLQKVWKQLNKYIYTSQQYVGSFVTNTVYRKTNIGIEKFFISLYNHNFVFFTA
jgi:hypothetical protein